MKPFWICIFHETSAPSMLEVPFVELGIEYYMASKGMIGVKTPFHVTKISKRDFKKIKNFVLTVETFDVIKTLFKSWDEEVLKKHHSRSYVTVSLEEMVFLCKLFWQKEKKNASKNNKNF